MGEKVNPRICSLTTTLPHLPTIFELSVAKNRSTDANCLNLKYLSSLFTKVERSLGYLRLMMSISVLIRPCIPIDLPEYVHLLKLYLSLDGRLFIFDHF